MDAARAAVQKITGRRGHDTEVDEHVNPAVTSETIKPHRHEETTQAVDREVHQDHYHTTVQPLSHRETLPEKHTHNAMPVEERQFNHDNTDETNRRVSAELGQFQNTSTTHNTRHTQAAAPTVTGEHVHHHVHETVQPVIHKETLQPEVVHTTVPVHEVHHEKSTHHGMSALPMKTLDEFKTSGGILAGNKSHTHEEYDGPPRQYNEKLSTSIDKVLPGHHGSSTGSHHTGGNTLGGGNNLTGGNTHTGESNLSGGNNLTGGSGVTSGHDSSHRATDSGVSGVGGKPSITQKLNPRTDADRDGKTGIMD